MTQSHNENDVRRHYIERKIATMGGRFAQFYQNFLDEGRLDLLNDKGELRPTYEITSDTGKTPTLHPLPPKAYEMYERHLDAIRQEKAKPEEEAPAAPARSTVDDAAVIKLIHQKLDALPKDDFRRQIMPGLLMMSPDDFWRTGAVISELEEKGPAVWLKEDGSLIDREDMFAMGFTPGTMEIAVKHMKTLERAKAYHNGNQLLQEMLVTKERFSTYDKNGPAWCAMLPDSIKQDYINALTRVDPNNQKMTNVLQELVDRKTDPARFEGERTHTRIRKIKADFSWEKDLEYEEKVDPHDSGLVFVAKELDLPKTSKDRYGTENKISYLQHPVIQVLDAIIQSLDKPFAVERPALPGAEKPKTLEEKLARKLSPEEQARADAIKDALDPGWRSRIANEPPSEGWARSKVNPQQE